ncbi:MAG: hypothetical protein WDN44_08430 [Sphingomonas sp.]
MLAERDCAVRFDHRAAIELLRAHPVLGLEPHQRDALVLEPLAALAQPLDRRHGLRAQPADAIELGADVGGARRDHRHHRAEHRADMDHVLGRSRLDQPQRRRPPRHRLERGDQLHDRPLPLGDARALRGEQPVDDRDSRARGEDVRFGGLDPLGGGGFLRARLHRAVAFPGSGGLERVAARQRGLRIGGRALEAAHLLAQARRLRAHQPPPASIASSAAASVRLRAGPMAHPSR